MARRFLELAVTPAVAEAQRRYFGAAAVPPTLGAPDRLGPDERDFIVARDSFYVASVGETGWPYVQHRGGPPGFLRVLDDRTLAFADYRGNRQMLSTGNVAADDRVALFLMDYPQRARLKLLGRATVLDAREHPELVEQLAAPAERRLVERIFRVAVEAFDWNCPKYITPRFTAAEIEASVAPLRRRIAELEAQLASRA